MTARGAILAAVVWLALTAAAASAQETPAPLPDELVGRPASPFTLAGPDGQNVSLESFRGKVVLLTFWDCFADVCFTSVSLLDDLLGKYQGRPFAVLTVCSEVPPALAEDGYAGLKKACVAGQQLVLDPNRLVTRLYRAQAPPTTFLVDRNGINRKVVTGVTDLRTREFGDLVDLLVREAEAK